MFVNSCLFKVCFVWILAFLSLFAICFSFLFLLELKWILQRTHELSFFAVSSIVKKSLLPHVLKEEKKLGFRVFTSPFNRILVAQKLFRSEALSSSGFEMDRSLKLWMIRPLPCWRQHLTLHMKTVLFHCLCVTYTFHSIMKCNKNIFAPQRLIFFSVLISLSGQTERRREREGERLGERKYRRGGEKGATYESVTVPRSPINHPVYTTHYLPGGPLF